MFSRDEKMRNTRGERLSPTARRIHAEALYRIIAPKPRKMMKIYVNDSAMISSGVLIARRIGMVSTQESTVITTPIATFSMMFIATDQRRPFSSCAPNRCAVTTANPLVTP